MKRYLILIKKDCLLLGKNLYTSIGTSVLIPILLVFGFSNTDFGISASIESLMSGLLYTWLISYFYLALEEAKAPKAYFLLSSIYTKREIVISRYLFFLLVFLMCIVFFIPIKIIFSTWFIGNVVSIIYLSVTFSVIILGIYMPFTYKWNIDVNKYLLGALLFIFSTGSIPVIRFVVDQIMSSSTPCLLLLIILIISLIILFGSIITSVKILNNKKEVF